MDAIAKFKEAAVALQQDARYLALAQARKAHEEDKELQDKIGQFNLVRLELNNEMAKDDRDNGRITQLNEQINDLYNGIMTNEKMLAYNEAKQDIRSFVNHIQAIVTAAVDGEDPTEIGEPTNDCDGSGCSTCGGCG